MLGGFRVCVLGTGICSRPTPSSRYLQIVPRRNGRGPPMPADLPFELDGQIIATDEDLDVLADLLVALAMAEQEQEEPQQ